MPTRAALLSRRTTPDARLALLACLALGLGAGGVAGCGAGPAPGPGPGSNPTTGSPTFEMPSPGPITHYTPAPAALQGGVDCLASSFGVPPAPSPAPRVVDLMGSVPSGFVPVDVVECSLVFPVEPATAGSPPARSTIEEQHLSGSYAALLAALTQPSDRQDGIACTADLEIIPDLWLVDAGGKAIHVKWPLDACGKSKPATAKALAGLHVASTKTLEMPVAP